MNTQADGRLFSFGNNQAVIHDLSPDILSHAELTLSRVGSKYTFVSEVISKQVFSHPCCLSFIMVFYDIQMHKVGKYNTK